MPVAVGIWNPKIILPKKMDYCNYRYMDFVLNHELVHIKRLDMLWKSCMVLALSLYWMNPFIWAMYILFVRDLEIACDERIIKKFGKESSSEYAYALVHFAENQNSVSSVYFNSFIVSAKYSCGFPDPQVLPIIVVDRYLDYFTTIMEDRLWQVLAEPVSRWRNRSGLSMNAARAA